MLRRIDELGRIVIPKELRKKLKIREGDFLDIYVSDSNIILQKYSALKDIEAVVQSMLSSLEKTYKLSIIVTDMASVVASNYEKVSVGKPLCSELIDYISKRDAVFINKNVPVKIIDDFISDTNQLIKPIGVYGDLFGAMIVFSDYELSKEKMDAFSLAYNFIVEYIDT